MSDPLAAYRKSPITSRAVTPPTDGTPGYLAFAAKDRVQRLRIRRARDLTHSPDYGLLSDISYDGDFGTSFVLTYNLLMMVFVVGRNLQPVILAIENGMAEFIQEYDSDRWPQPKDQAAPFIETIEIIMQESGPFGTNDEKPVNSTKH